MPRLVAYNALRSGSMPLLQVDRLAESRGLESRDRALARRIVGTEIRRRGTLRALVRTFGQGRLSPELVTHLHVAFVQLFFLDRIPTHAVRSMMFDSVRRTLGGSKIKVARATLDAARHASKEGRSGDPTRDLVGRDVTFNRSVFRDPAEHPFLWVEDALSLPAPLAKRWTQRFGRERTEALARWALDEPRLSVRVVHASVEDVVSELESLELTPTRGAHERILLLPSSAAEAVAKSDAMREGRLTIQGETALRAAEAVEARPGERVLDLCAAPGGKTAVLAEAGASVVAADSSPLRLERVGDTLARLQLRDRARLVASDAGAGIQGEFDAVLVDAPCSNTGVLAQRPEARWRFGPASTRDLGALQTRLFDVAAARVRPGGRLVWSTCALEPAENRGAVAAFLERTPGWSLEHESESLPDTEGGPGPIDGGYVARLRRADG